MEQAYMSDIWIFPLEPLDGRYTKQWYDEIPRLLEENLDGSNSKVFNAIGKQRSQNPTDGGFLDFCDTNYWKSTQLAHFVEEIHAGNVSDDAHILITDFWNPAILQLAYMRDLLGKSWILHGIAHAGAYDPTDILGLKMRKPWPWEAEKSFYYACDYIYFGTHFHREMFLRNLQIPLEEQYRAVVSGQPHGAILEQMKTITTKPYDERTWDIIWPHRYNEDKQPEIAENLSNDFSMLITQKQKLTKSAYYEAMANSKVMFSCSLHENLGISLMEGVLVGTIPFVPDRCSYHEMYLPEFKYPSVWTENYENFMAYRPQLVDRLNTILANPDAYAEPLRRQRDILVNNYLSADIMVSKLTGSSE
jgi:hypothetical protein